MHTRPDGWYEVGSDTRPRRGDGGIASPAAKLLFAFATLTASRTAAARLARWSEVDLEKRVWTVPAEPMKAKREHRIPLATETIQVWLTLSDWLTTRDLCSRRSPDIGTAGDEYAE